MADLWSFAQADGPATFLKQSELLDELNKKGINPAQFRAALRGAEGRGPLVLSLANGSKVVTDPSCITDLMTWSWVPIVSGRAKALMLELGAADDDFEPCRFDIEAAPRYLHLPLACVSGVDVRASKFQMILPGSGNIPDFPIGLEKLVLTHGAKLPESIHMFRIKVPSHDQVFAELIVDRKFKQKWESRGLSGARFSSLNN